MLKIAAIDTQKTTKVAPHFSAHREAPAINKSEETAKTTKTSTNDGVLYGSNKGKGNSGGGVSFFKKKKWLLPALIILPIQIVGAILLFGGEKIECQYCDQKFSPDEIEAHIHAEHWFLCTYCDTVLHSEVELNSHITQEHTIECQYCLAETGVSDVFQTEADLNHHITQKHTIECQYCLAETGISDVFHTQAELNSHLDSAHVVLCIHCDTVLHSKQELDEHIASVYNFQCEYCEEVFFTQEELDAHIVSDHTFSCPVCSEAFHSYAEKEAHFAANHDRFAKSGNVISDYKTNLHWRVGPDSNTGWNEANSWVNGLGGSWRMPSLHELGAIYNAGIKYGDWGHFQNSGAAVWSSQTEGSSSAWCFNFSGSGEGYFNHSYDRGRRAFAVRSQ